LIPDINNLLSDAPYDRAAERDRVAKIAMAVIQQAFKDLRGGHRASKAQTQAAEAFLTAENPDLTFWCDAAGLQPRFVIAQAQRRNEIGRREDWGVVDAPHAV
jgi:hypothetical protein